MTHLVQSLIGIIPHSTITKESVKKTYGTYTRLTSFYCTSLFNSQMLHCLQIEGLWQACVVYWYHFSNSICLLHVSVLPFGNPHSISNYFICIIFVIVILPLAAPRQLMGFSFPKQGSNPCPWQCKQNPNHWTTREFHQ